MLREGRNGTLRESKHVVTDEDLTVALRTSTNADRRHFQTGRYPAGQLGRNRLEDNRKHARLLENIGIFKKAFRSLRIAALRAKSAQLMDRLRRQPKMPHNRNSDIDQPLGCLHDMASAAFDLYGCRAAFLNQPAGISHGFFHAELECEKGHVGHDQGPLRATAHGLRVMNHHVEGHRECIIKAQDNHADRISNQNDVDTRAVQQPCHSVVIRC